MDLLSETMKTVAAKMKIDFESIKETIQNSTLKGNARENELRYFLKKYLPFLFGIHHGEIVSTDGKRTRHKILLFMTK